MRSVRNVRLLMCLLAASCSTWAYRNEPLPDPAKEKKPEAPQRATFSVEDPTRMRDDVVVCLALSGGGSRAAWFSSAVMLELGKIEADPDLLNQVDVISSVSGGSLASAYFAVSQDAAPHVRLAAPPRAKLPELAKAKVEFDAATRHLTATGPIADDEAGKLRDACDPADARRIERLVLASRGAPSQREWDHDTVRELMTRDYVLRCLGNMFWPTNIALYWCTAFDRGDIMAETFADNLFDSKQFGASYGRDLTFADLNPARPRLILNSTDGTDDPAPEAAAGGSAERGSGYGDVFTFTREDFTKELHSDLATFPIAHAVMSSASFPGAFPYRTLRNYDGKDAKAYVHVFDGGNSDNLGLLSIKRVIREHALAHARDPKKTTYVVICVDSYTAPRGARTDDADPRKPFDYLVDGDFFDAIDMLLKLNRYHVLSEFMSTDQQQRLDAKIVEDAQRRQPRGDRRQGEQSLQNRPEQMRQAIRRPARAAPPQPGEDAWEPNDLGDHLVFWHLTFRDLYDVDRTLYNDVNKIATDFKIDGEQANQLERAAKLLVEGDPDHVVAKIKSLLAPH